MVIDDRVTKRQRRDGLSTRPSARPDNVVVNARPDPSDLLILCRPLVPSR